MSEKECLSSYEGMVKYGCTVKVSNYIHILARLEWGRAENYWTPQLNLFHNSYFQLLFLGADSVILERVAPGNDQMKADTQEHLDVSFYRSTMYLEISHFTY
jgi:hypothetical protein